MDESRPVLTDISHILVKLLLSAIKTFHMTSKVRTGLDTVTLGQRAQHVWWYSWKILFRKQYWKNVRMNLEFFIGPSQLFLTVLKKKDDRVSSFFRWRGWNNLPFSASNLCDHAQNQRNVSFLKKSFRLPAVHSMAGKIWAVRFACADWETPYGWKSEARVWVLGHISNDRKTKIEGACFTK